MPGLIEIILLSVLGLCFTIQMIFYWVVLAKPYYRMKAVKKGNIRFSSAFPPVSVIIYVNRAYDLRNFLSALLEQEYPIFEVIVINDGMNEENKNLLYRMQERYPNLYHTHIPEETRSVIRKKLGLTLGVKAAKYDCLLFTEADSHTRSADWIKLMARHFGNEKTMILGMSAKESENKFFPKFITFDYFYSNLQMLSMALFNHPYTGCSRSLICSKTYFNGQKELIRHLLDNKNVHTKVELSPESVIVTNLNGYDWAQEKYEAKTTALWKTESFFGSFFILSVIACLVWGSLHLQFLPYLAGAALFCYLTRLFSQLFVVNKTASFLELEKFHWILPIFDLSQIVMNIYLFIYRIVRKKRKTYFQV